MLVPHVVILLCLLTVAREVTAFESMMDYVRDGFLRAMHTLTSSHSIRRRDTDRTFYAKLLFDNCGDLDDPVYVENLDITPNPIVIPGDMAVSMKLDINENQTSPIPVKLEIKKKLPLLFDSTSWIKIPCFPNGIGSCPIADLCSTRIFDNDCIDPATNETTKCGCPFQKGVYNLKPVTFVLPEVPENIPDYLLEGEIHVTAIVNRDGRQIACYSTSVDIQR